MHGLVSECGDGVVLSWRLCVHGAAVALGERGGGVCIAGSVVDLLRSRDLGGSSRRMSLLCLRLLLCLGLRLYLCLHLGLSLGLSLGSGRGCRSNLVVESSVCIDLAVGAADLVEVQDLGVHHHTPGVDWQISVVEVPVELGLRDGLVSGVVVWREVWVCERLSRGDTLLGVEHEHALKQVDGIRLDALEALLEWDWVAVRQRRDELQRVLGADGVDDVLWRRAKQVGDDGELVDVVLAREQGLSLDHLGEDAARGPDIHLDVVLLPCEHDLGCAVVTRRDVAGHLRILDTREAEIADLEVAVLVDQDVAGLEVAVDDARGVHVLETTQDLIQKVLHELLLERPRLQQPVQIRPLQLGDEVDVLQRRQEDILQSDQVLVSEMLQQLEHPVRALREHRRRKRLHDLLDGDGLLREVVGRRAHQPECTHPNRVQVRVPVRDLKHSSEDLGADKLLVGSHG